MFDKFKSLSRVLCFIFLFNFMISNFGIKSREAKATIIDINSTRVINYDLKVSDNYVVFDFSNYLSGDEKIESFVLKKGETTISTEAFDDSKKAWKSRFIPLNGDKYEIQAVANLGGKQRKLTYNFVYNDYDVNFEPIGTTSNNNISFDMKAWAANFPDDWSIEADIIKMNGATVIPKITKTVKDVKASSLVFEGKKVGLNSGGYVFRVKMNGRDYKRKFFYDNVVFRDLSFSVPLLQFNNNGNIDISFKTELIYDHFNLYSGGGHKIKKMRSQLFEFRNIPSKLDNDYEISAEGSSSGYREAMVSVCRLSKFDRLDCGINVLNDSSMNLTFPNMTNFFSVTATKNKAYVYELNDNFTKGTKIASKESNLSYTTANTINLNNGVKFSQDKSYLIELTNGDRTVTVPFVYIPVNVSTSEIKTTSAKLHWEYPAGYTPVSGDKVEIYLRDKSQSSEHSAIPRLAFVHGSHNVNLSNLKSVVIGGIAPNTNYEAKFVLNNQRGSISNYLSFTTSAFRLKDYIQVNDVMYQQTGNKIAYPRSRNITVTWDFEPTDIEFASGDKVEIFLKPNGNSAFSSYPKNDYYKNPVFTATENLKTVKSANIQIPTWMSNIYVDLIYTIGGKQVLTSKPQGTQGESHYNRRTVYPTLNKPSITFENITQTTAKVKWNYDSGFTGDYKKYEPENGHIIKIHLKKINSLNDYTTTGFEGSSDAIFHYVHGQDGVNLLEKKEFDIKGLEPNQCYRAKIIHILQLPGFDNNYRDAVDYANFKTEAFSINNLTATQESETPKVKLTWETTGVVEFADGDNVKIYLKEATTSQYPETPVETIEKDNMNSKKDTVIELPKYNTPYNVKVEYELKGKKISQYVLTEATGIVDVYVTDISEIAEAARDSNKKWSAKINWTYPEGYTESTRKDKDKIKLTVKKHQEASSHTSTSEFTDKDIAIETKEEKLTELEANATYDVKLSFMNSDSEVYTVETSFKATSDLQVIGLIATDVKAKTATLKWEYIPESKDFQQDDKVEISIKKNESEAARNSGSNDLKDYTKIYTFKHKNAVSRGTADIDGAAIVSETEDANKHPKHVETEGDMTKFKSLDLKELGVNKEYSVKIEYMVNGDSPFAEVSFKTMVDAFKATVFSSDQTTSTYGWEYPNGYELQEGDKIEIFVKEVSEEEKSSNVNTNYGGPLLTLEHGTGDDKHNLNEITRVDVSGLTPEKKYKSKIDFTMGTGDSAYTISQEVDISTKSFEIKSFEVDSYEEYDILVKWEIEPEDMVFNPSDTAEIFVKLANEENYPSAPSYKLTMDDSKEKNISNTFSDYVLAESIGVDQKMKLVYTIGGKKYEKELEFNNTIDPINASVFSVDETRALIQIETPKNYEFVNGDKLLIYSRDEFSGGELESDDFLVFEGVQSDALSIADDMKLIELSYLLPEANYEVLIVLDLLDGKADPVKLKFLTGSLPVSDIKLEAIKYNDSVISWDYGDNSVDFYKASDYDTSDKLIIAHKESDGTPIPEDLNSIKKLKNVEYLGGEIENVKDSSIQVGDISKDYDVIVCYDLGGLLYTKSFKASYLSVSIAENSILSDGAKVGWKYPSNVTFTDDDKTEIFIRKKQEASYPESPVFTSTGSSTTGCSLESLEGSTEYVVKVQVTKEGIQIYPVEVEFTTLTKPASEVVIEEIQYEIVGMAAQFAIPDSENIVVDKDKPIGLKMGEEPYQGFTVVLDENGTSFIIQPTIPKKKYENIEVEIPLEDGTVFKISIKEFVTQPEDIAQDWISNAYSFAFERFPDEEGYNYWYEHRMLNKTLNGEYFLKNLMFAEDEFTNRNLADKDLIAALYQIVVNREFDEEGLNFWVGIYNENLQNASGDKKLAQEVLVDRMVHEPEFGKLCDNVGIFWRQSDQDAAGVNP